MKYFVELSNSYRVTPSGKLHPIDSVPIMGETFFDVNGERHEISDWEDQSGYVVNCSSQ